MNFHVLCGGSKHYYPSLCGHCHEPGTTSSPLKRCSGCQCLYYCSRDHQKKARREHRSLCEYIAQRKEDSTPLFGGHSGKTRDEMLKKMTMELQIYKIMEQKVEQIFINPPVCRKTGCFSPGGKEGLVSCPVCLSVSWCSDLHLAEAEQHHQQFCLDLKLARVVDSLENKHGLPIIVPDLSCHQDLEYQAGPQTMLDHLPGLDYVNDYGLEEDCDDLILQSIFASDLLSGPLTLFEAARKTLPDLGTRESLKVHIVGAEGMDLFCLEKWNYLADTLLPALKVLDIQFVDPNLGKQLEENNNKEAKFSKHGQSIKHSFYKMPYEQFRKREDFSAPDLVLVQNCGFTQYKTTSLGWTMGWEEGVRSLLHRTGAPVIFTSLGKADAQRDLDRFRNYCGQEVEVLVKCEKNPMRSYRPLHGAGLEDEIDVYYNNYYISIVRVK